MNSRRPPLPGIGPLTGALEAFAEFFGIDRDLVQAAAESGAGEAPISKESLRETLAAIAEDEKAEILARLVEGDSHVAAELRRTIRNKHQAPPSASYRTVGQLRIRAQKVRQANERAEAERLEAERCRKAEEAEKARRARLRILRQRGGSVWREIEDEIERRNASGYDKATGLLSDLQVLAAEDGSQSDSLVAWPRSVHGTKRSGSSSSDWPSSDRRVTTKHADFAGRQERNREIAPGPCRSARHERAALSLHGRVRDDQRRVEIEHQ